MRRPGSTPSNFLFHRYSLASLTGALLLVASLSLPAGPALAQAKGGNRAAAAETGAIHQPGHIVYDTSLYAGLQYRMIGPFRGGRATAVAGVSQKPHTFYLGATGGGVWKTEDAGQHWDNVSDDYFHVGSIGAITVAPSDPDVVYVGTGSADIRGNVSTGKGVYRSTDGGKSWSFEGLEDAGQIGDIVVSPRDPDLVYLASIGHAFGPNPTRGVFRSRDGGKTWQKVLFVSDSTGFIDLAMDPNNPRVLYAAAWQTERKPWTIVSGGHEGGIWKSTDGGDHWTKLGGGLPTGLVGKASVTVSPADPDRVWVLIEASPIDKGGVYRSDDAGKTWRQTSHSHDLTQRAFYYIHIFADPKDPNTVYALNTSPYRSIDGGKTFTRIRVPHGDTHDFWINPEHPDYLAIADDGGAQVSLTHGKTWSTYYNQPTAQFYRVITDNGFPYRVYGPQQDNSTISVPAWSPGTGRLTPQGEWVTVGGGESGYIALDPDHPKLSYAGSYGGDIDRMDRETGQGQNVVAYPQLALGEAAKDLKYRFQWNAPILMSKFDSSVVYHAAQYVLKTTNGGQSWTRISPDLTRDDTAKQVLAGKPIESEETGVEVYGTIFALAEGTESPDVLWAGSDDGLVHLTRDGGKTWKDVTPPGLPAYSTVNVIAPSPHQAGQAYVTAYRYRMDDWHPYVYETKDWGAHWTRIADGTRGIPAGDPVRVVREDPVRAGLLYAGTEFGMYVSFDDGAHWQTLQQNLPPVPVTDLTVHGLGPGAGHPGAELLDPGRRDPAPAAHRRGGEGRPLPVRAPSRIPRQHGPRLRRRGPAHPAPQRRHPRLLHGQEARRAGEARDHRPLREDRADLLEQEEGGRGRAVRARRLLRRWPQPAAARLGGHAPLHLEPPLSRRPHLEGRGRVGLHGRPAGRAGHVHREADRRLRHDQPELRREARPALAGRDAPGPGRAVRARRGHA